MRLTRKIGARTRTGARPIVENYGEYVVVERCRTLPSSVVVVVLVASPGGVEGGGEYSLVGR